MPAVADLKEAEVACSYSPVLAHQPPNAEEQASSLSTTKKRNNENSGSETTRLSSEDNDQADSYMPELRETESVILNKKILDSFADYSDYSLDNSEDDYVPVTSEESSSDINNNSDEIPLQISRKKSKPLKNTETCSAHDGALIGSPSVLNEEDRECDSVSKKTDGSSE